MQLQRCSERLSLPDLPPKRTFGNLNPRFLQERARDLNAYLQELLSRQYVTKNEPWDRILATFLTPGDYVPEYSSVARKMDGLRSFFSLRRFNSTEDTQPRSQSFYLWGDDGDGEDEGNIAFRLVLAAVDEIFDFSAHNNNALRARFLLMVRFLVENYMGALISTRIVGTMAWLLGEAQLQYYLSGFRESFWPNGVLAGAYPPRDKKQKETSYREARARLVASIPEQAKKYVGGHNCRQGLLRCFDMLQHRTLNRRLALVLLEGLLVQLFPDLQVCTTLSTLLQRANYRPGSEPQLLHQ